MIHCHTRSHITVNVSLGCGRWYKHLTLEVILAIAFGRDIKVQGGEAEELYQQAQAVVNGLIRNPGGQFGVLLAIGGRTNASERVHNYTSKNHPSKTLM